MTKFPLIADECIAFAGSGTGSGCGSMGVSIPHQSFREKIRGNGGGKFLKSFRAANVCQKFFENI